MISHVAYDCDDGIYIILLDKRRLDMEQTSWWLVAPFRVAGKFANLCLRHSGLGVTLNLPRTTNLISTSANLDDDWNDRRALTTKPTLLTTFEPRKIPPTCPKAR